MFIFILIFKKIKIKTFSWAPKSTVDPTVSSTVYKG